MANNSNPLNGYRFDTREKGIESRGEQLAKLIKGDASTTKKEDAKQDKEIQKLTNDLAAFKKKVYTKTQADDKFLTDDDLTAYAKKSELNAYAKKADVYNKSQVYTKAEVDAIIPTTGSLENYATIVYVDGKVDEINTELGNKAAASDVTALDTRVTNLGTDVANKANESEVTALDERVTALENAPAADGVVFVNFTETGREEPSEYITVVSGTTDRSRTEIASDIAAGKLVFLKLDDSDGNTVPYMSDAGGQLSLAEDNSDPNAFLLSFSQTDSNVVFTIVRMATVKYVDEKEVETLDAAARYTDSKASVFVNFTETGRDESQAPNFVKISGTTDLSRDEIAEHIANGATVYLNTNDSEGNKAIYMSADGGQVSMLEANDDPDGYLFSFTQSGNNVVFYACRFAREVEIDAVNARIDEISGATQNMYTKAEVDNMIPDITGKVDKELTGANGRALIFNESDGGGAKFEHSDGTMSFAGVNDGGENGIAGQVYALKRNAENRMEGARIDVTKNAMYYTVGDAAAADRMVPENEIATKGDIPVINLDNYYTKAEIDTKIHAVDADIYDIRVKLGTLGISFNTNFPNEFVTGTTALGTMLNYNKATIKVVENTTVASSQQTTQYADNTVTLNLNGKTLTFTRDNYPGIIIRGGATVTISGATSGSTIDGQGGVAIQAGVSVQSGDPVINFAGSNLVVRNNRSGGELIYCYKGLINIYGGTYRNDGDDKTYMINCYDANYQNGTANIVIYSTSTTTGPKFYDFNPADCSAEGAHTNFVREDCHVVESTVEEGGVTHTVYMVVKNS